MRNLLFIALLLLFAAGCKGKPDQQTDSNSSLYPEPKTYKLNLQEGYRINPLTGAAIKPLVNSLGNTIHTGIPYSITPEKSEPPGIKNPAIVQDNSQKKTIIESNSFPIKGKPEQVPANPVEISSVTISANSDSIIVKGSEYIVFTHKTLTVSSVKIALHEPQPVKIQPMRYKDNALLDIQYLDIGQGLPYSYIYAMHQDKNGYLWMGTDYGLCKYDGTYLTVYTEKEGLINNKVNTIAEDNQGRLWIGTYTGFSVFDGTGFLQFTDKKGLLAHFVSNIKLDSKGDMWITLEGIGIVGFDGNTFTIYTSTNEFRDRLSPQFFTDNNGEFWLLTLTGLIRYDGKCYVYYNPGPHILEMIKGKLEDSKGNSWFFSDRYGITKFDGKYFTHYTTANGLSGNSVFSFMIDKRDNIWMGTRYNGLNKFDGTNFTEYESKQGLSENKIGCTLEDKQGNIWIGTLGGGVNKLNEKGFAEKIPFSKLNNSRVRPIVKDISGRLWFGTEAGSLYSYNETTLNMHIESRGNNILGFRSSMSDKDNNLWFGEQEGSGFYKYDYRQFRYFSTATKISSNLSLFEDKEGSVWIGTTEEGVAAFTVAALEYYNESNGFPSKRVFVTMQDKKGNLWFGTEGGGIVKFDGKLFTVFSEKQGLFCKSVTSIIEDENGNLWLGTLGAGLCMFDGSNFTYYTEKQGLAFNSIWSLKKDTNGQIWAGTDNGLSVLIPQKNTEQSSQTKYSVYSFGLQDGLSATDFNLNGVCIDNSNRIWWGTGKALITRDLSLPFKPDTPQSLQIIHFGINGIFRDYRNYSDSTNGRISFSSIQPFQNYPDNLSLAYDQNHLTFQFSAIDWSAPHQLKYSYRLIGQDEKWSTASSETSVDYRNLSYGHYEFQLKAIGQSQVWTKPLTYRFIIRPAWWQTWWFRIAAVLAIIAATFLISRMIYRARLRRQKLILEKQLAVQMERQRIASEMHDDIGAGLSGIRLLTEVAKSKSQDMKSISEIEKIYLSVGDVSAKMKEVIWSLNTENDSLEGLITYLQKNARQMMEHYPGHFEISLPQHVPEIRIAGEKRRHIYLAVKEALHNIIKHSGAGKAEMKIETGDQLLITISDNGRGLKPDAEASGGNGLKNMHNRMKEIDGDFFIKNENGLLLSFTIPLRSAL